MVKMHLIYSQALEISLLNLHQEGVKKYWQLTRKCHARAGSRNSHQNGGDRATESSPSEYGCQQHDCRQKIHVEGQRQANRHCHGVLHADHGSGRQAYEQAGHEDRPNLPGTEQHGESAICCVQINHGVSTGGLQKSHWNGIGNKRDSAADYNKCEN